MSIKKNTEFKLPFQLVDKTDGGAVTSGSVTVNVSKDGGAQATATNAASHLGGGQWVITLTATEMNADTVAVSATHDDAVPVSVTLVTVAKLVSELNDIDGTGLTVTAGTVSDKTGYSLAGTQTFNVTGNITGNLSGSVGSVSGSVGSVTGNIGGNVAGSVDSVTDPVTVGTISNNAITADAIAAAAFTDAKFSGGYFTAVALTIWEYATTAMTSAGTIGKYILDSLDALLTRLSSARAGYLDKLNVSGTLAHSDAASAYQADVSAVLTAIGNLNDPDAVTVAAAVWDRVLTGATHNIATSAGRRLRELGTTVIWTGTAQAGTENTIQLDTGASAQNEIYDENLITILSGTGAGQTRVITDYNGTSKVAIVNRVWEVNPDNTSEFQISGYAVPTIVHHGVAQAGAATTITLDASASAVDGAYIGNLIYISTSTGSGQTRVISAYNGTTKVATVNTAWTVNPTSASVFKILPDRLHYLAGTFDNTDRVDALIEDSTGDRFTAKALETAPSGGSGGLTVGQAAELTAAAEAAAKLEAMLEETGAPAYRRFLASALEEAPSGAGLTAGQAAELTAIKAKTDLITVGGVEIISPVLSASSISITAGDDYTTGNSREITLESDDWIPILTPASTTVYLNIGNFKDGITSLTKAGTIAAGKNSVTFEITRTESAEFSGNSWMDFAVRSKGPTPDFAETTLASGRIRIGWTLPELP